MEIFFVIFFLVFQIQASEGGEKALKESSEYKMAEKVAKDLIEETRSALMKKMSEAGPAGAVEECSRVAQKIAREKEKENWRVRRVSLKFRNPENKPDPYEEKVLKKMEEMKKEGKLSWDYVNSEIVEENGKKFLRYMRPIFVGDFCLKCHGKEGEIPPDVREKIKKIYPEDKAINYSSGELRGAVSIRVPVFFTE